MTLELNRIYQGDCLDLMREMEDKSVDLVLTDPPYRISGLPPGDSDIMSLGKYNSSTFTDITDGYPINDTLNEFKRILKKVNIFVFCSNLQIPEIMGWGFNNKYFTTLLVWNKTNSVPFANGVWRQDAEFIIHIRESGAYFQGDAEIKRKVTRLSANPSEFGHPSEKPTRLIEKFLMIGSKADDLILDPFLGSGTTAVACKKLGRNFIGIEREPAYIAIAEKRLEKVNNHKITDFFGV